MPVFSLDGLDEVDRHDEIWIYSEFIFDIFLIFFLKKKKKYLV